MPNNSRGRRSERGRSPIPPDVLDWAAQHGIRPWVSRLGSDDTSRGGARLADATLRRLVQGTVSADAPWPSEWEGQDELSIDLVDVHARPAEVRLEWAHRVLARAADRGVTS